MPGRPVPEKVTPADEPVPGTSSTVVPSGLVTARPVAPWGTERLGGGPGGAASVGGGGRARGGEGGGGAAGEGREGGRGGGPPGGGGGGAPRPHSGSTNLEAAAICVVDRST